MSIETIKKSEYYHLSVPADGHCFFHAVSGIQHLYNNIKELRNKPYTYRLRDKGNATWLRESKKLRINIVQWMKDNLDKVVEGSGESIKTAIQDAIEDNSDQYSSIDEYLQKMKKSQYGGQPEIYAVSEILDRNIITYVAGGKGTYKTYGGGLSVIRDENDMKHTIRLYHNVKKVDDKGGHHFEILFPRNVSNIVPKEIYDKKVIPGKEKTEKTEKTKKTKKRDKTKKKDKTKRRGKSRRKRRNKR